MRVSSKSDRTKEASYDLCQAFGRTLGWSWKVGVGRLGRLGLRQCTLKCALKPRGALGHISGPGNINGQETETMHSELDLHLLQGIES